MNLIHKIHDNNFSFILLLHKYSKKTARIERQQQKATKLYIYISISVIKMPNSELNHMFVHSSISILIVHRFHTLINSYIQLNAKKMSNEYNGTLLRTIWLLFLLKVENRDTFFVVVVVVVIGRSDYYCYYLKIQYLHRVLQQFNNFFKLYFIRRWL